MGTFNSDSFLPLVSIAVYDIVDIGKRHIRTLQVPYVLYVLVIIATHPKGNRRRNLDLGYRNAEVKSENMKVRSALTHALPEHSWRGKPDIRRYWRLHFDSRQRRS